jgi:hypothetical protein
MNTNPGPNSTYCPTCAAWRFVWRIVPLGNKATDGYRRVCAVCGEGEK